MNYKLLRETIKELERFNGLDEDPNTLLNILKEFNPRKKEQDFGIFRITRSKDITSDEMKIKLFDKYYNILESNIKNDNEEEYPNNYFNNVIITSTHELGNDEIEELGKIGVTYDYNK